MARTQLSTREIGSVQRNDFDTTTTGQAVVTKLIAGTNVSFTSSGVDAGTGDVTINVAGGSGITSLGVSGSGQTGATQTLAVGTSGSDFNIASATNTHTFNLPDAGNGVRGVVSTGTQTFYGAKTFNTTLAATADASIGTSLTISNYAEFQSSAQSLTETWLGTSSNVNYKFRLTQNLSPNIGANSDWISHRYTTSGTPVGASSGTHPFVAQIAIKPVAINANATTPASFTNGATLYIEGPATGTATITNNYALWVDAGNVRFDGAIISNSGASTLTLPTSTGTLALTSQITGINSGTNTGDQTITLTGNVTGSGTGSFATTIASNVVANSMLAQMAAHTYKGNNTGSTANAIDVTTTQLTADLNLFTSTLQGLVPASGGGTTNFLRADGTWAAASGGSGLAWTTVSGTSQTMAVTNGYVANNASLVTFTLPTTAAVNTIIRVVGLGAGGWKIAQNASQIIHLESVDTTTGTSGYISSNNRRDAVELLCVVANTEFSVISGAGNFNWN